MSSLKIYEWNRKLKLVIIVVLLIPVAALLYIQVQNFFFDKKVNNIRDNIKIGMHKSEVLKVIGTPTDSGYVTKQYEINNLTDTFLSLAELINEPKESYYIYNFGRGFFRKEDDLSLRFDTLDILIKIKSPHLEIAQPITQ